ncbi:hypothetical protein N665_2069s0007, partial [Sinapis alba]
FLIAQAEGGPKLSTRLFVTDRYPQKQHNIYSRADILAFVRHVLRDTPEFKLIKESCSKNIFDLPTRQCLVSCKLIHSLMSRQLVCNLKNTSWSAFGGKPLRYMLQKSGTITRLPCGDFPAGYVPGVDDTSEPYKDHFWRKLIGKNKMTTITDFEKGL